MSTSNSIQLPPSPSELLGWETKVSDLQSRLSAALRSAGTWKSRCNGHERGREEVKAAMERLRKRQVDLEKELAVSEDKYERLLRLAVEAGLEIPGFELNVDTVGDLEEPVSPPVSPPSDFQFYSRSSSNRKERYSFDAISPSNAESDGRVVSPAVTDERSDFGEDDTVDAEESKGESDDADRSISASLESDSAPVSSPSQSSLPTTFDHFLVVGADLETSDKKTAVSPLLDALTNPKKQNGLQNLFNFKSKASAVPVQPSVLMHFASSGKDSPLPTSADSIAKFCFPRGVTVKAVSLHSSMSDVNSILYGPYCQRGDGSFIFTFNDDTGVADGGTNSSTIYGVCVTQPRLVGAAEVPRVYCILTRIPHFDLHFRVLWDVLAAQRIGRIPVDGNPGHDQHGYDTLDFIRETFVRYSTVNINNEVGTFVSFQVCNHLPPIIFRPVPTISRLLTSAKADHLLKSIQGPDSDASKSKTWIKLRRESVSATSEWSLTPLFSVVPKEVLCDVLAALMQETQLVVLSERLGMLSSTVLGLAYLLKPLLWVGPLVPLLPETMVGILDAPVPFIAGYPSRSVPPTSCLQPGAGILRLDDPAGVSFSVVPAPEGGDDEPRHPEPMPGATLLLTALESEYAKLNNSTRRVVTKGPNGSPVVNALPIYNASAEQLDASKRIAEVIRGHVIRIVGESGRGESAEEVAGRLGMMEIKRREVGRPGAKGVRGEEKKSSSSTTGPADGDENQVSDDPPDPRASVARFVSNHRLTQMSSIFASESTPGETTGGHLRDAAKYSSPVKIILRVDRSGEEGRKLDLS